MMQALRNSRLTPILWMLFSLYLFNLSADIPDANPRHEKEDLSINDQESMIELLVEQVLGLEDVFEEYEDPDSGEQQNTLTIKIDFFNALDSLFLAPPYQSISNNHSAQSLKFHVVKGFINLTTPPPKG